MSESVSNPETQSIEYQRYLDTTGIEGIVESSPITGYNFDWEVSITHDL